MIAWLANLRDAQESEMRALQPSSDVGAKVKVRRMFTSKALFAGDIPSEAELDELSADSAQYRGRRPQAIYCCQAVSGTRGQMLRDRSYGAIVAGIG